MAAPIIALAGYSIDTPVCTSGDMLLYRATRNVDGQRVLVKVPAASPPTPDVVRRLETEYELARLLDSSLVARPLSLERHGGSTALILEMLEPGPDRTLADLMGSPMDVQSFLHIAIGITSSLIELHRHELVHKDIKPEHILLDDAGHVWLTGLGIASRLPREHQAPEPPGVIRGTLAYMSPEQTGRMNRSMDSRSDLYSLGVTFYQMLTGVLPFTASTPMEWVHCHIAREPLSPEQAAPMLPHALSDIVTKLLAKTAEERYQTAAGLGADLQRCLEDWQLKGRIDPFVPGEQDVPDRLLIPEKLYGRTMEIGILLDSFQRVVASGRPEIVLVSGYSGVGKTSLVSELHRAIVEPRGLFATGKFDQYRRDIPCATLIPALQTLVRHVLGKSEAEVAVWRRTLQEAVNPNGQLIVSLIPEVEMIIGEQPPVPDIPPREAKNRFQMVLAYFLSAFAGPDHPLVLFLDDLQWLDGATLDVIEQLVTGQELHHLLLIGAYRDNEVGPTHPLMRVVDTMRRHSTGLQEIVLSPLAMDDVASLVADSLHCDRERALPLAQMVHEKTGGNPFFSIQFLTALAEDRLLTIDAATRSWTWDMAGIYARGYTDNVVDLMVGKLARLPDETLEALKQFACLGNVADIATLRMVCGQSDEELHRAFWEAVRAGLAVRHQENYAFSHDRVHEAAYALVPSDRRADLHLKIGRLLLSQYPEDVLAERVFEVVDQFNRSIALVTAGEERATLRRLNAAAGRKARGAVAYESARRYLEQAVALLPANHWNDLYADSMTLFTQLAECENLLGHFERSDGLLSEALQQARTLLDRVLICRMRQRLYQSCGRWQEAVGAALEGLALFGVSFPDTDEELRSATAAEKWQIEVSLRGRRIADLADVAFTDDLETQALIGLLAESITLFFITRPVLWHLVVLRCVNLCLQKGHVDESPYIYSSYCKMLVALYDDIPTAFEFSQMSLALNERRPGAFMKGLPPFFHASVVANWRQHFATNLPLFDRAFQAFLDSGDIIWASYLTYNAIWLHFENGDPLEDVMGLARRYVAFNRRSRNDIICIVDRILEQLAACLQGKTRSLTDLQDDAFDETASVAAIEKAGFRIGLGYYRIIKQIAAFIAGDFDAALTWAEHAEPVLGSVSSMAIWGSHPFYHALTMAALYDRVGEERRPDFMKRLMSILERLKFWAQNCPENFLNRHLLVSAELARIEGRDAQAMRLYDQAIRSARENNFVHQEALAAEVASRFYRARGFDRIADAYVQDAHACYARWGAWGKARQLEQSHPGLHETSPFAPTITFAAGTRDLDIVAVIQASQAISREIVLVTLLKTLMRILLETAGARQGYLLLDRDRELELAAAAHVNDSGISVDVRGEHDFSTFPLPTSIMNYVRRSGTSVLLDDATLPHAYSSDAYFSRRQPRSVLCSPINRQTRLIALLYLENDLATGAFTPERVGILELLAGQAAISLENALIYEALRTSETRYRMSQQMGRVGNWEYNILTTRFWASDEAKRIYGFDATRYDFSTEEVETCIPERERVHQALVDLIQDGRPYNLEFEIHPGDSSAPKIIASIADVQRDHQGNPKVVLGVIHDISERRHAEEEIRKLNAELERRVADRTAQLEAANQELEAFAYSVSHDLRAPLRAIDGFVNLLRRGLGPELDEQNQRYMTTISGATRRMGMLIDDLLSFSRMGRAEMTHTLVDLGALVQEVLSEFEADGRGRMIDWRVGMLPAVTGDSAMLRIVLVNLISNALKFTQQRERAEIEIGCAPAQDAGETVIFVRDNGVGFDMQYVDKLFGVFQRLHGVTEFEGTGIGLANVRRIIGRHGGRTWAEGRVDGGATFYFALPSGSEKGDT